MMLVYSLCCIGMRQVDFQIDRSFLLYFDSIVHKLFKMTQCHFHPNAIHFLQIKHVTFIVPEIEYIFFYHRIVF